MPFPTFRRPETSTIVYAALFGLGLFIRLFFLNDFGSYDMAAFIEWGEAANELGLAKAYQGMGFPFQWLSFQVSTAVADGIGIAPHTGLKIMNLMFELGTFALLVAMLKRYGKNPAYALLFWCHPWFLIISILGYAGVQYSFMILLVVYLCAGKHSWSRYCWAGIPLGIAFLMKPQALIIILAAGFFIVLSGIVRKDWKPAALTVAPIVLFIVWSLFFFSQGTSITVLAETYLRTPNVQPSICAQMLNGWYPLAYFITDAGREVVSESDLQPLFGPFNIRPVAFCMTVGFLVLFVFRLIKRPLESEDFKHTLLLLFGYASLVLPMLMTSAHENHAYLATIFFILLSTALPSKYTVAMSVFMVLQCLNVLGLYGVGMNSFTETYLEGFMAYLTPGVSLAGSILSTGCFLIILGYYFQQAQKTEPNTGSKWFHHPFLPSAVLLIIFPVLYMLAVYGNA